MGRMAEWLRSGARAAGALGMTLGTTLGTAGWGGAAAAHAEQLPGTGTLRMIAPDREPVDCPLEQTRVSAQIAGFAVRVVVEQVFRNPSAQPLEAVYTFPLSARAAVNDMSIRTGEREIRGQIKRREEARRIYEQARDRGQLAALLDQERPNIFSQSIANLMPGASVEIRIEYTEPLEYEAGTFEFSFPTVVGPRFVPGRPSGQSGTGWALDTDRVRDASRITPPVTPPGTRAGHDISITVDVDAGVPIRSLESPLHAIAIERISETRARVMLKKRAEIPNRDFVLRYAVATDEVKSGYLVHRNGDGRKPGYATFVLIPPRRIEPESVAPRELVFVIDRSGSQSGLPLAKAKESMLWMLERLNPNDTFQIVSFGSTAEQLFPRPEHVTRNTLQRARSHIQGLRANGGTMMAEAVQRVAGEPADRHRLRIVAFMTDGYIGNDFEVLSLVKRLRGTSRWFPFGTGNATNRYLLDNMARLGGGEVEYVLLDQPGPEVARRFYERIESPVLTDVRIDFEGLHAVDVYPNQVADVWAERPLYIHARYDRPGRGRVILSGYREGRPYRQELDVALPARHDGNEAIASMWARSRVGSLMDRDLRALQSGSYPDDLKEEVVRVALEHGLVTQFTSFVAVEDRIVNEGGVQRRVTVPVELPDGVSYEGIFGDRAGQEELARGASPFSMSPRSYARSLPKQMREAFAGVADSALAPTEGRARELERSDAAALSADPQKRLAPVLLRLLRGTSAETLGLELRDGQVRVKVTLAAGSKRLLSRMEKAGLAIQLSAAEQATGWIEVDRLTELAALDGVERVDPA